MDISARFSNGFMGNGDGQGNGNGQGHAGLNEELVRKELRSPGQEATGGAEAGGFRDVARASERETKREETKSEETKGEGRQHHPWHDEQGRFKKGNPGGPGNPYNRAVAALKREAVAFMTPERMQRFVGVMYDKACKGDTAAGRILERLTVPAHVDPDQVDLQEWKLFLEESKIYEQIRPVMQAPDPEYLLGLLRITRQSQMMTFGQIVNGGLALGPAGMNEVKAMPQNEAVSIMNEVGLETGQGKKWLKAQRRRAERRKR